jgi:uncharacterized tellurite resistance protein B-like protein
LQRLSGLQRFSKVRGAAVPTGKGRVLMVKKLKHLLRSVMGPPSRPDVEQPGLAHALAALLYEVARMDLNVADEDLQTARVALTDLAGVDDAQARTLLEAAAADHGRLTSYHDLVSAVNRDLPPDRKVQLIEHMWRVAHVDGSLDPHEDHLVRKISDLLYVPHIQCMLARQRAREGTVPPTDEG